MKHLLIAALALLCLASSRPASAHPAPFSYLDLHVTRDGIDVTLVAHIFDVAHELHVDPADTLLAPGFLVSRVDALRALWVDRLSVTGADGKPGQPTWTSVEPLPERQSVQLQGHLDTRGAVLTVDARLFPYDPAHQTFVNVYENDDLTLQAILDGTKTRLEYFSGTRQGALALARRFVPAGLRHILVGSDHLAFLVGLMLLGGSRRQVVRIISSLLAAEILTLTLTLLRIVHPAARLVEPAVALGIVYVGADNLMVQGGRDVRHWIALGIGTIHGFWFANGLESMDLPRRAFEWSLFSFDAGLELAQFAIIVAMAMAVALLHRQSHAAGRRLVFAGSVAIIVFGAYLFVQRVFFPGGLV